MLKVQPALNCIPKTTIKCGEIFYHSFKDFTIFCTFCQIKSFQFDDFIMHIQNVHSKNESQKFLSCQSEGVNNPTKLNQKRETFSCENEDDEMWYNIEDELSSDDKEEEIESCDEESLKVLKKSNKHRTTIKMRCRKSETMKQAKSCALEIEQNTLAENIVETSKKPKINEYRCTECYEIYFQKKYLDQHVQELHNGYKCSLCDKRFRRSSHVACHLKTHTTVKKFICPIESCGRGFIDEDYLKRHLEVHTMERNFICAYENCGKAFQTHRRLASHEYTHRIPKKFVCDVCGFSCRSSTVLVTHQRVHTGEKPFPCEVCSKPFISKTALNEHMISHSETRPHKCSICNKAFANRRVLVRHSYIHSDERTFKCKLCESAFKHPNSLQGHMRHVHREPKVKTVKKRNTSEII